MNKWLPILLCLYIPIAISGLYKWEDADGKVHYTDQAPDSKAEELELPPISSYTAPKLVVKLKPEAEGELEGEAPVKAAVPYEKLTITSPKMNETIRSNDGIVSVAFSLTPGELHAGDSYRLMLDGRAQKDVTTSLLDVARGSHTVKVQIVDASGVFKFGSSAVIFHLHREADGKETTDGTKPADNTEAYKPTSGDADHSAGDPKGVEDGSGFDPTNITDPDDPRDTKYDPTFAPTYDPKFKGKAPAPGTFNAPAGTYTTPNYNQK